MKQLNIGGHVIMIENNELRKGVVKKIFYEMTPPVVMVEFDDGKIEKVNADKLALEPKTETQEKPSEPVEKTEITITSEEFQEISAKVIANEVVEMGENGILLVMVFSKFLTKLHKALFGPEAENE